MIAMPRLPSAIPAPVERSGWFKRIVCSFWIVSALVCTRLALRAEEGAAPMLATGAPNILLVVADDLGIELGCYGDGQAKTPHIDRMAAQGVRFETAWVTAASCSPSRASIHTGLYPHQNGLTGLSHHGFSMNKRYPTIASSLKERGYRTGVIGKFHIAPQDICPWDFQFTQEINRDVLAENRDVRTMALMAEGIMAGNTGPFFLMMSYIDPHAPLFDQRQGLPENTVSADDVSALGFSGYTSPALRERTAGYYNCISRLDTGIGLLMDALERQGKLDNTLVVLIGDHGAPFARAKMSCYDRGLRIPLIAFGPGLVKGGRVSKELASTIDLLPTFMEATGTKAPAGLPGKSLLPILQGIDSGNEDGHLYASHYAHQKDAVFPMRAIRDKQYLLIENLRPDSPRPRPEVDGCEIWPAEEGRPNEGVDVDTVYATYLKPPKHELYDLAADPYCFKNLAADPDLQNVRNKLADKLNAWRYETGDPLLSPNDSAP
jgi:N-sulfoglucosamine sulfohydrolase